MFNINFLKLKFGHCAKLATIVTNKWVNQKWKYCVSFFSFFFCVCFCFWFFNNYTTLSFVLEATLVGGIYSVMLHKDEIIIWSENQQYDIPWFTISYLPVQNRPHNTGNYIAYRIMQLQHTEHNGGTQSTCNNSGLSFNTLSFHVCVQWVQIGWGGRFLLRYVPPRWNVITWSLYQTAWHLAIVQNRRQ